MVSAYLLWITCEVNGEGHIGKRLSGEYQKSDDCSYVTMVSVDTVFCAFTIGISSEKSRPSNRE